MPGNLYTIDFHSHILPGVDHGCASTEEFTAQLALMRSSGVDVAVATPHFYPSQVSVASFCEAVDSSLASIQSIRKDITAPELCVGAEVLLCDNIHRMPQLEKLCIRGTNVLLIEFPFQGVNSLMFETVEELIHQGYTVVLAHVDRYLPALGDGFNSLLEDGAYAQINATALLSVFGRKKLLPFLQSDRLVAFGSDLHGTDPKRCQAFAALSKHLKFAAKGDELPDDLLREVMNRSAHLLENATRY